MTVAARPIGDALGTEITGVDLTHLSDVDFAAIEEVFRDHPVLVFRHQKLSAGGLALRSRPLFYSAYALFAATAVKVARCVLSPW